MRNNIKMLTIAVATLALCLGLNSFAHADIQENYKVAVVDVSTIVAKSAQIQALKKCPPS